MALPAYLDLNNTYIRTKASNNLNIQHMYTLPLTIFLFYVENYNSIIYKKLFNQGKPFKVRNLFFKGHLAKTMVLRVGDSAIKTHKETKHKSKCMRAQIR